MHYDILWELHIEWISTGKCIGMWKMYGKGGKEQLCAASISCRVNFNLLLFCDRMQANQTLGYWGAFFDIFFFCFFGCLFVWVCFLACWSNDISVSGRLDGPFGPRPDVKFLKPADRRAAISFNDRKRQPRTKNRKCCKNKTKKKNKNKTEGEIKIQLLPAA